MKKRNVPLKTVLIYIVIAISIIGIAGSCFLISQAQFGVDYACFYTTGKMVSGGEIAQIYNLRAHHAALEEMLGSVDFFLEWVYPPSFLLIVAPLSYLPYPGSLAVWLFISFIPAALAVYLLAGRNKLALLLLFMYPGSFLNIRWGQNGFLTAGLVAFGVYFVETNPLLAGLAFGLLTFKPQMAVIPFFLLLVLKKWKVLGWSFVFALALAALSALVFGVQTWVDFFTTSFYNAAILGDCTEGAIWGIPTFSTTLRCIGISGWMYYALLLLVATAAIFSCVRVWKQTQHTTLRLLSLVLCVFLSLPYVSLYDFAILGIPITLLFLEWRKNLGASFHPLMLGLLWLLPLISLIVFLLIKIQICPFLMMAYMLAIVRKAETQSIAQTVPQIV